MFPFDVVTARDGMVCNSRSVTILRKSFEELGLPVMQSSLGFSLDLREQLSRPLNGKKDLIILQYLSQR